MHIAEATHLLTCASVKFT